jgi:hypothetical protein
VIGSPRHRGNAPPTLAFADIKALQARLRVLGTMSGAIKASSSKKPRRRKSYAQRMSWSEILKPFHLTCPRRDIML